MTIFFIILSYLNIADSLFYNNFFDLSEIEYKRLFFFDSSLNKDENLRLNYTLSVLHNNPVKGYRETQRFIGDFPEMGEEVKVKLGLGLGDCGFYSLATEILSQTDNKKWCGYYCLSNGQFYEAQRIFLEGNFKELAGEIERFLKKKKSATKAMIMSAVLPGSGELYAGNKRIGFFDFLLTWGSGYLFYGAIKNKKYVDASLIFGLLFSRFYFGSISNAGRLVEIKNREDTEVWLENLRKKYFY
uniref:Uncharacterized protein n=1 Tax=candidate division WOR-3 bacterium TaxID=2052148 RepID=A0A7C4TDC6_UNCW3